MDDRSDRFREANILMALASGTDEGRHEADRFIAEERDEHYRELEKNFGESLPTAEDFRLLDEIDTFATKVKSAIRYLADRGHGPALISWALRRHTDVIEGGCVGPLSLVDLVACDVDERTKKGRRKELKEVLVAAGATTEGRDVWQFLFDAGKPKRTLDLDHPEELWGLEMTAVRAHCEGDGDADALDERVADVRRRSAQDSSSFVRLNGLGLHLDNEEEEVPRDDQHGEAVRSSAWIARARRRRREDRRHFGRSKRSPR